MLLSHLYICYRHWAPVNPDWFYLPGFTFLVPAHSVSPGQNPEGHKTVVVVVALSLRGTACPAHFSQASFASCLQGSYSSTRCVCLCLSVCPITRRLHNQTSPSFWPTVLSVEPMVQYVVCLSVVCLSVTSCIVAKRCVLAKKCLKEWIGNQGRRIGFFGSPPYFYFRFRCYSHRDGRFCLIFARIAQQSVLDGTNGVSSSKPYAYSRIVRSELKPNSGLFVCIT